MIDRPSDPSSAEARLREAIMHMTDGLAVYDSEGRLEICNDSFRRINNYSDVETEPGVATYDGLGRLDEAQDSIDHKPLTFQERMAQLRRDGANVVIQHHGGRIYERHQSATPSGGMLSMLTDITDLRHALDAADQASRAKSEFLATMSHEIRTPIAGILGLADILLDDDQFDDTLSADRRDKVASIKSAGQSLITILNDILDLSKIHSGKLALEDTEFDLHGLIAESLDIFYPTAHAKGIALGLKIDPQVPPFATADPTRLRQVLVNLIGNAVKFTEQGSVSVEVTATALTDTTKTCRFAVIDTGIGIAESDQAGLFEDFAQVDASTARKYAGTGLGLAISKRLTHLMGGEIGVESTAGAGATFWFAVPLSMAAAPVEASAPDGGEQGAHAVRPLKILLAEDNGLNQMIITTVLAKFGHDIIVVDDGRAAVDAVAGGGFDLVLMDVRMPELDGTDATREIRASAIPEAGLPIIAVTADAILENRAQYLDAGMDACVTKPIDLPELLNAINDVLDEEVHVLG